MIDNQAVRPMALSTPPAIGGEEHIKPTLHEPLHEAMSDWSGTGRGSHVEFGRNETIPLQQGHFLGRGAMGDVHETNIHGHSVAWKKMVFRRKITLHDRKEIEILKKLSHVHMIQVVGTYTYRQYLGVLLYPVAICDLYTFFDDVEAYSTDDADDIQRARLGTLNYFENLAPSQLALPIYSQIGCLISAIAYLHSQKIRHKDLKPSNILLSHEKLYLSDFGSATDFSLVSQSATNNERGTPRYFAPEVAAWEPNGRAADMFSLGCVMLEILVLQHDGSLERLRVDPSTKDPAFHANLDNMDAWFPLRRMDDLSLRDCHLVKVIRSLLSRTPERRPSADQLLSNISLCDMMETTSSSVFRLCCQRPHHATYCVSKVIHEETVRALNEDLRETKEELTSTVTTLYDLRQTHQSVNALKDIAEERYEQMKVELQKETDKRSKAHAEIRRLELQLEAVMDPIRQETGKPGADSKPSRLTESLRKSVPNVKTQATQGSIGDWIPDWVEDFFEPDYRQPKLHPRARLEKGNNWSIYPSEKRAYDDLFSRLDADKFGVIVGEQGKSFFGHSGLEAHMIEVIWQRVDVEKRGCLLPEEFASAMALIRQLRDRLPVVDPESPQEQVAEYAPELPPRLETTV